MDLFGIKKRKREIKYLKETVSDLTQATELGIQCFNELHKRILKLENDSAVYKYTLKQTLNIPDEAYIDKK